MKRILKVLAAMLFVVYGQLRAQSPAEAAELYDQFLRYRTSGQEGTAYNALYQSYETYVAVLGNPALSAYHTQARSALKEIFPDLQNAAYFYTARNDMKRTLQFACAHVDLSFMPAMQNEGLQRNQNYVEVLKLAAFNTYNTREYARAIPYFYAYLSTGDPGKRKDAFYGIGYSYYQVKDYANAKQYLAEGLRQYPGDQRMLRTIFNAYQASGNLDGVQPYLTQLLSTEPTNEALLNLQGKIYEEGHQFQQAVDIYQRLRQQKPQNLDVAKHLASNYYDAGIVARAEGKAGKSQADYYFRQAEPLLNNILASDPLSVKYACALANVYSLLGETGKLQAMNEKLASLGIQPVEKSAQPVLMNQIETPTLVARNNVPQPVTPQPVTPSPVVAQVAQPTQPASPTTGGTSDVDTNLPVSKTDNTNTFAVIIYNEDYTNVARVPMARNDGSVFADYCHKVLGLPLTNIRTYENATSLMMEDALVDIQGIARAQGDQPFNVVFYYAGHGVPDEATRDAFLMPVDASGQRTTGCLRLDRLYDVLGSLGARQVCVFLDACFSGSVRGNGMLVAARGVEIDPEEVAPKGNMVVFSATTAKQTAMPYEAQSHGLFTYYLLKKLKESKGRATLEDLGDYLTREVSLQSQLVNRKAQTPSITASALLGDRWRKMKLK